SESDRWLLASYKSAYRKSTDSRPSAVMEKQPKPTPDLEAVLGADPNPVRVFQKPTVFTGPQLFGYFSYIPSQDALNRRTLFTTDNRLWLLPTGRAYFRIVSYQGLVSPKGDDTVFQAWGRYTIEADFRVRIEYDSGEQETL